MNHCTCTGDPNSAPMLAQVFYLPLLLPVSDSPCSLCTGSQPWFLGMQGQCTLETQTNIESQSGRFYGQRSAEVVPVTAMLTLARDTRSPRKGLKNWHPEKRLC